MARCFVSRPLPGNGVERLRAAHEVELWPEDSPPPRAALEAGVESVEGLLCLLTDPVDAAMIAAAPRLRAISNMAVGVDNIDVAAATERGIPVGHTPEVLTDSTADLTVGLMLAIARRITDGERVVRAGEWGDWGPEWMLGRDLHGATVAIVGGGRIGRAVAGDSRGSDASSWSSGAGGPSSPRRSTAPTS